jgi:hypothetical protein
VDVALPAPDRAEVDQFQSKLTVPGNAAVEVGIPTTSSMRVRLWFGARAQDMTADPRTLFDTSRAGGLFTVDAQRRIVANAGGLLGTGQLRVHFVHVAVEFAINVTIIGAAQLELTPRPFPIFSGSGLQVARELNPMGATGVTQRAALEAVLTLTDGQPYLVSTHARISYQAQPAGVVVLAGNLVSRASAGVNGTVDLTASFAGVATAAAFQLTVSDTPVVVRALGPLGFTSTLTGLAGARAMASLSATFTDNTEYAVLFSGSAASPVVELPGLVSFQSSRPEVAPVNAATGVVTLQGNLEELVTLQVQADGDQCDAQHAVCLQPAAGRGRRGPGRHERRAGAGADGGRRLPGAGHGQQRPERRRSGSLCAV